MAAHGGAVISKLLIIQIMQGTSATEGNVPDRVQHLRAASLL